MEQLKEMTALYVEDDPIALASLSGFLGKRLKHVFKASNGQEGLELYRRHRPDLVVTDLEMPLMDGKEMIRQIREEDNVPIIITTGYDDAEHHCDNANQVLVKPIILNELMSAIVSCIGVKNHHATC